MGLLTRGERKTETIKAGTYQIINFEFNNPTALVAVVDLTKVMFGAKYYSSNSQGLEIVKHSPLYHLLIESMLELLPSDLIANQNLVEIPANGNLIFSLNLENFLQLLGNDYIEWTLDLQIDSSPVSYTTSISFPKAIGVMEAIPVIDVIQLRVGVSSDTIYCGSDVERIVFVTGGTENLRSVQMNSKEFSPNYSNADLCVNTAEYMENFQNETFVRHKSRVIFDGTKTEDLIDLDEVSLDLNLSEPAVKCYLVVRRNKTSTALMSYAERLKNKHAQKYLNRKK